MSYRRTSGILSDSSVPAIDSDVIMTSVILGFASLLVSRDLPVRFDVEISATQLLSTRDESLKKLAEDTKKFLRAVDKVNHALSKYHMSRKNYVAAGVAPYWCIGSLITGHPNGENLTFDERHIDISLGVAKEFQNIASRDDSVGYQGRGAYTGLVSDYIHDRASIKSTARFNVPAYGYGDRWVPSRYRDQDKLPWGLIGPSPSIPGMVEQPSSGESVVGYTHGMVQAVYDCVAHGPGAVPYEIAVGNQTTKLCSCIPCTLFMYSSQFPPSSIHLGRGESWTVFYPKRPGERGYSPVVDTIIERLNHRWTIECTQHLRLGVRILRKSLGGSGHFESLKLLEEFLLKHSSDPLVGGNLVLDAITVHDAEANRILRTIEEPNS